MKYAVIETGGKQYLVHEGQELKVEKLELADGEKITFDALLMSEDGTTAVIGAPVVKGSKVTATILKTALGEKISIVKYKRKVRYRRHTGHRQPFTAIKIDSITA